MCSSDLIQALFTSRTVDAKGKGRMTTYILDVLGTPEVDKLGLNLLATKKSWNRVLGRKGSHKSGAVGAQRGPGHGLSGTSTRPMDRRFFGGVSTLANQ